MRPLGYLGFQNPDFFAYARALQHDYTVLQFWRIDFNLILILLLITLTCTLFNSQRSSKIEATLCRQNNTTGKVCLR